MANFRQATDNKVINFVWCRAAGHCELCSKDLTLDLVTLTPVKLGEVAHIFPASKNGPRAMPSQTTATSKALTDDPKNLMLLCTNCHTGIDKTPEGYPANDLTDAHLAFVQAVEFAANVNKYNVAAGVIILGHHFTTSNNIDPSELQAAMWRDRLRPISLPLKIVLPEIDQHGRDDRYYGNVRRKFKDNFERELTRFQGQLGDKPVVGVVGLADIPSLIICGQEFGDRIRHEIYSTNRVTRLMWPDKTAGNPDFTFTFSDKQNQVNALVISISAEIPDRDVIAALPNCEIAKFKLTVPNYGAVQNPAAIDHFGNELQKALSRLEAASSEPIHVFAAIPAAMAIKFGSLLSTNHKHPYAIYDRDPPSNAFRLHIKLNDPKEK